MSSVGSPLSLGGNFASFNRHREPGGAPNETELEDRMGGVPEGGHRRKGGSGQAPLISVVAVLCLALAVAAGPAVAKKITGGKRS